MTDEKKPVDWAEIERDYRTSPMSVREIARWYGVNEKSIRKRAKANGWERPQARSADPEPQKVYVGTVLTPENTTPEAIVGRGRNLVMRMLDELDATTTRIGELEDMIVSAIDEGADDKQKQAAMAAVSLKGRSEVLKALATAAKTFAEAGAPAGVKKQRQEAGERVAKGGGKFSAPAPPLRLVR